MKTSYVWISAAEFLVEWKINIRQADFIFAELVTELLNWWDKCKYLIYISIFLSVAWMWHELEYMKLLVGTKLTTQLESILWDNLATHYTRSTCSNTYSVWHFNPIMLKAICRIWAMSFTIIFNLYKAQDIKARIEFYKLNITVTSKAITPLKRKDRLEIK